MSSGRLWALRALTTPGMLLLHVAAVAAMVAATLLGQWQIDAWQEQRRDRAAELADAAPVPLSQVLGPDDPFPAVAIVVSDLGEPGAPAQLRAGLDVRHDGVVDVASLTTLLDEAPAL